MGNEKNVWIEPRRAVGVRDEKIYGHFLEHFHRQIYGGIFDPQSPLADENGYRRDVADALRAINPAIVRWPGGCYVSAYHWKDGVGKTRVASFDKAWRVEESNSFGTDEYVRFCRTINAEPYICTNAGSGTCEEMSDWVEYCNLKSIGKWAKKRIENGITEPHNVKYWSIGNENYGYWEMGAKSLNEWGRFVKESAKMMKRVDPTIQLLAASISDLDWNANLLREAGSMLDWISIHGYWDTLNEVNNPSCYETCMARTLKVQPQISKTRSILDALGFAGKIRIAFDEWNLRGWHHPHIDSATEDYVTPRDKNDINSDYTMADAVFCACFFNDCLRNCDVVGMANFAPSVNTRGMIFTHHDGIVLRPQYFVFELYTKYMGDKVVDTWLDDNDYFDAKDGLRDVSVPSLDVVATQRAGEDDLRIAVVNRHSDTKEKLTLRAALLSEFESGSIYSVCGKDKNSYNDIKVNDVKIEKGNIKRAKNGTYTVEVMPHSVNVIVFSNR